MKYLKDVTSTGSNVNAFFFGGSRGWVGGGDQLFISKLRAGYGFDEMKSLVPGYIQASSIGFAS
jgi:hypothetical protein